MASTSKFPNTTDKQIIDREQAEYEGQIPVNETGGVTREIVVGETTKVQGGKAFVNGTGVIMPYNDRPAKFETPGKK